MFIIQFREIKVDVCELKIKEHFLVLCSCYISIAITDFVCLLSILEKFKLKYMK